ncbi:hypothetical protein V6N13_070019 [Hibiscus sabdariffa]
MSKSTWERKFDVYKKCGWSEKEILEAFRRNPIVMARSEYKIKAVMDFLVNVMGFQASSVAKLPNVLGLSMEKRIVPRGLLVKDLMSMGLLEKKLGLWMLGITEEMFLKRFVYSYEEKAPELLKLYNEKLKLAAGGKLKTDRCQILPARAKSPKLGRRKRCDAGRSSQGEKLKKYLFLTPRRCCYAAKELETVAGPVETDPGKLQRKWKTDIQQRVLISDTRQEPPWTSHRQVAPRNSWPEVGLGAPWPLPPLEVTATLPHKFQLLETNRWRTYVLVCIGTSTIKITFEKTTMKTIGNISASASGSTSDSICVEASV